MSKFNIDWDQEIDRKYELGTDRGVIYPTYDSTTKEYKEGAAWNGLTSVEEAPSGADANDIWADNMKYATLRSAEQFGFTIEAYTYPVEFLACDGVKEFSSLKGLSIFEQPRKKFGFAFRSDVGDATEDTVDPDAKYKLHLIWGASASPSSKSYETINDSPDAMTFSWECTSTPQKFVDYTQFKPVCRIVITRTDANATEFDALEDKLYNDKILPTPDWVLDNFGVDLPSNS